MAAEEPGTAPLELGKLLPVARAQNQYTEKDRRS